MEVKPTVKADGARATAESIVPCLWQTKKYCDAVIHCGTETIPVHTSVVCLRSVYFDRAFEGSFKESSTKSIDLEEVPATIVKCCLEYLYLGDYELDDKDHQSAALTHAQVYAAADQYLLTDLKPLARRKFGAALPEEKDLTLYWSEIVAQVYETAHPGADELRCILVEFLRANVTHWKAKEGFWSLVEGHPRLAFDLLQVVVSPPSLWCSSKHCKTSRTLHAIPACDACGLASNLVREEDRWGYL